MKYYDCKGLICVIHFSIFFNLQADVMFTGELASLKAMEMTGTVRVPHPICVMYSIVFTYFKLSLLTHFHFVCDCALGNHQIT